MNSGVQPAEEAGFSLLLRLDMGMESFASDWAYCDRLSTYVARMIGHNRTDSLLYSNLFSSALNELLETAFRMHRPSGNFACSIWRRGPMDRIELAIPGDAAVGRFYHDTARELDAPNIAEQFRAALFSDGPLNPSVGLLELAVDYNAGISITAGDDGTITLAAEFSLEGPGN